LRARRAPRHELAHDGELGVERVRPHVPDLNALALADEEAVHGRRGRRGRRRRRVGRRVGGVRHSQRRRGNGQSAEGTQKDRGGRDGEWKRRA
jgi:hypothetical protein